MLAQDSKLMFILSPPNTNKGVSEVDIFSESTTTRQARAPDAISGRICSAWRIDDAVHLPLLLRPPLRT